MTSAAQSAVREVDDGGLAGEALAVGSASLGGRRSARPLIELVYAGQILAILALILEAADATTSLAASAAIGAVWTGSHQIARVLLARRPFFGPFIVATNGSLLGLVLASLGTFWLPGLDADAAWLLAVALVAFVAFGGVRAVVAQNVRPRRVLVVGAGNGGALLADELRERSELPYECIGVVSDDNEAPGAALVGAVAEVGAIAEREQPDLVVVAETAEREAAVERLLDVRSPRFRLLPLSHFYEHAFGRVPIQHLSSTWFISLLHLYRRPYPRIVKRAFDLTLAALLLVPAAPLMLVIALLVRRSGPGPILFRQIRLGEGGEPFEMLKFRTMVDRAEQPGRAVWTREDDRRITSVGRRLRKWRLDELPQLWNVLRGDMSVVGPRPERPEFLERLQREVPFWTRRHLTKPGLTGWAQVRRGYTGDALSAADKLSYDLYYLKHQSLALDLAIALKTAWIVFSGFGAR